MKKERGQALVLVALGIVALAAMLALFVNAAAFIIGSRAVARAAEDAAVAGLRTARSGEANINATLADQQARNVLRAELGNVRFMSESPAAAAGSAVVNVYAPGMVQVTANVHLCPPLWSCIPYSVNRVATLETTVNVAPAATKVPPITIVLPTPTPMP